MSHNASVPTRDSGPRIRLVLCDLDGVVWLAHQPIPGAAEAIASLRAAGCVVLFVTNNSTVPAAQVAAQLASCGIPAEDSVLGSAAAAATMVRPGERVLVCGEAGLSEAIAGAGAIVLDPAMGEDLDRLDAITCDTVVVGLDRHFSYLRLANVAAAVRSGARLIATNGDPTYPTPHGPVPGAGSIVAAVAVAAGREPIWAGKPHQPMADLARAAMAAADPPIHPAEVLMVGDRYSTDGGFAQRLGVRFVRVRSGVADDEQVPGMPVWAEVADLAEVAELVHAGGKVS